jgi:hypothetical protein
LRAKVLRNLFEGFPDGRYSAKAMDEMKERAPLPESHRLYVSEANHVVFGESTTRGKLTSNCAASLKLYGLPAPALPSSEQNIIIGDLPRRALPARAPSFVSSLSTACYRAAAFASTSIGRVMGYFVSSGTR